MQVFNYIELKRPHCAAKMHCMRLKYLWYILHIVMKDFSYRVTRMAKKYL